VLGSTFSLQDACHLNRIIPSRSPTPDEEGPIWLEGGGEAGVALPATQVVRDMVRLASTTVGRGEDYTVIPGKR
jgi:hypothetical protein